MTIAAAFAEYFGLTRAQSAVLEYLHRTHQARSVVAIARACNLSPGAVPVHISAIREAMDAEALDSQPSYEGQTTYWLSEIGREECRKAVAECRKAMA